MCLGYLIGRRYRTLHLNRDRAAKRSTVLVYDYFSVPFADIPHIAADVR